MYKVYVYIAYFYILYSSVSSLFSTGKWYYHFESTFTSRCFLRCRHLENISFLLFRLAFPLCADWFFFFWKHLCRKCKSIIYLSQYHSAYFSIHPAPIVQSFYFSFIIIPSFSVNPRKPGTKKKKKQQQKQKTKFKQPTLCPIKTKWKKIFKSSYFSFYFLLMCDLRRSRSVTPALRGFNLIC